MSYSSLHQHASMVLDEMRNRAYLEAMRRVIKPNSNQAIAEEMHAAMPHCVHDGDDTFKRIGALSARYRAHPLLKT